MASKSSKTSTQGKAVKARHEASGGSSPQKKESAKGQRLDKRTIALAAAAVIIIIAAVLYSMTMASGVPFSTFRSDFQSASRVSITATYATQAQLANETSCFTSIIQVVAHTRQPSTIDFFIIDNQSGTCTYSSTGLGGSVNPVTTNATYCLSKAYAENGIFLNYSASNSTLIRSKHMFVYGNNGYLAQCPIAIDLS